MWLREESLKAISLFVAVNQPRKAVTAEELVATHPQGSALLALLSATLDVVGRLAVATTPGLNSGNYAFTTPSAAVDSGSDPHSHAAISSSASLERWCLASTATDEVYGAVTRDVFRACMSIAGLPVHDPLLGVQPRGAISAANVSACPAAVEGADDGEKGVGRGAVGIIVSHVPSSTSAVATA